MIRVARAAAAATDDTSGVQPAGQYFWRWFDLSLAAIAQELRVTPAELNTVVQQGPHSADKLPKLLNVPGINEEKFARIESALLQDVVRVCSTKFDY